MLEAKHERRRHVVYYTKNTEYHCRDKECVGVRDRSTRRWQRWHPALRNRLLGSMRGRQDVSCRMKLGAKLLFEGKEDDSVLLTSMLLAAGRPPKESLIHYMTLTWAGEIRAQA